MLVRDLVVHLLSLDENLEVYTAGDEEGNSYRELYFVPSVHYMKEDGYDIRMYAEEDITDDPEDEGWDKTFRGDLTPVVVVG